MYKVVIEKTNLNPAEVGDIVIGSVLGGLPKSKRMQVSTLAFLKLYQLGPSTDNVPRGLQAVAAVAVAIKAGLYDIGIGAGVESVTANPMAWDGSVNPRVKTMSQAQYCLLPMGISSENVTQRFGVTRKEQDQAAGCIALVDSHRKAAATTASGKFKDEIIPAGIC